MNQLKELQDKIHNLLPELKVSDKLYKAIGLAEVLRVLNISYLKHEEDIGIDIDGCLFRTVNYEYILFNVTYNLLKPLLKHQTEEVINFLNDRI